MINKFIVNLKKLTIN